MTKFNHFFKSMFYLLAFYGQSFIIFGLSLILAIQLNRMIIRETPTDPTKIHGSGWLETNFVQTYVSSFPPIFISQV